jgi:uncharacterized membrane protein YqjE
MRPQRGGGLAASGLRVAGTLVEILQTRLELLAAEVEEEKLRLGGIMLYAAMAFFFLGFGLVLLAVFLTVLFWDTHRELVLAISTGIFLFIGLASTVAMVLRARSGSRLFAASLAELRRDREALGARSESAAD